MGRPFPAAQSMSVDDVVTARLPSPGPGPGPGPGPDGFVWACRVGFRGHLPGSRDLRGGGKLARDFFLSHAFLPAHSLRGQRLLLHPKGLREAVWRARALQALCARKFACARGKVFAPVSLGGGRGAHLGGRQERGERRPVLADGGRRGVRRRRAAAGRAGPPDRDGPRCVCVCVCVRACVRACVRVSVCRDCSYIIMIIVIIIIIIIIICTDKACASLMGSRKGDLFMTSRIMIT